MTDMAAFAADPPKGAISNLETGEVLRFQFNPVELVENIGVNWARISPLGLSHQVLHYINTNNQTMPIELYMSDIAAAEREGAPTAPSFAAAASIVGGAVAGALGGIPGAPSASGSALGTPTAGVTSVGDTKNFLQSLAYPVATPAGGTREPATVLFVWPSVVRMKCKVASLAFTHRRFSLKDLKTTVLVAAVTLEECAALNVTADRVRLFGSRRD
jgi:hypothetical protein